MRKLVSESINEFERGISKNTLGIGKRVLIVKWLEEMGVDNYSLNKDLTIDVEGDVDLKGKILDRFPEYIKFNRVSGSFDCMHNNLTTLEGGPKEVFWSFYCSHNNLTTLEGGPVKVGGSFFCNNNNLTTLKGFPTKLAKLGNNFDCRYNNLTTLEGGPIEVVGWFDCSYNNLITLDGCPTEVDWDFFCNNNEVKFTKKDVRAVCGVKGEIYV